MKKYLTLLFSSLGLMLLAGSDPLPNFVPVPANPEFRFARTPDEAAPISSAYWIAKYPVTNAEYALFCRDTRHRTPRYWTNGVPPAGKANHPVLWVSAEDARSYCEWLEKKYPEWHFRLPTEAEWENAASGPRHFSFPWGNRSAITVKAGVLTSPFNFNGVTAAELLKKSSDLKVEFYHAKSPEKGKKVALKDLISLTDQGQVRGWINHQDYTGLVYTDLFRKLADAGGNTSAVDAYPTGRSPYGCFDMAGNSWDWTGSEIIAANGAERGQKVLAVRGGSWYANSNSCRTDYRGEGRRPSGCYSTVGFRPVAVPR